MTLNFAAAAASTSVVQQQMPYIEPLAESALSGVAAQVRGQSRHSPGTGEQARRGGATQHLRGRAGESDGWNREYTNTRIHEYTNTRIHEYTNTRIHEYTNTRIHEYTTNSFVLRPPAGTFFYRQQDERRSPIKAKQMATAALARQATVAAPAHGRDDSPRSFGTIISSDIHVQG